MFWHPLTPCLEQGVFHDDELSHDSCYGDLGGFSSLDEFPVFGLEVRIKPHGDEGGHIKRLADICPSAANEGLARPAPGLAGDRSRAGEAAMRLSISVSMAVIWRSICLSRSTFWRLSKVSESALPRFQFDDALVQGRPDLQLEKGAHAGEQGRVIRAGRLEYHPAHVLADPADQSLETRRVVREPTPMVISVIFSVPLLVIRGRTPWYPSRPMEKTRVIRL